MSGDGTFAGTNFQAKVIAFVYVHILGQIRLGWLRREDDTPLGVWAETGGVGDDARIDFGQRLRPVEVQAKFNLTAGAKLRQAVLDIASRGTGAAGMPVVLAVNTDASKKVRVNVARDLDRLRTGRVDGLDEETEELRLLEGVSTQTLSSLYVVSLDLDKDSGAHATTAVQLLASALENKAEAERALGLLFKDASELCERRQSRTRPDLVSLLESKGIKVLRLGAEEHRRLDVSRDLLNDHYLDAALRVLARLEEMLAKRAEPPDVSVRYRIENQRALANLYLGRPEESLKLARRAVELDPSQVLALTTAGNAALASGDLDTGKLFLGKALEVAPQDPGAWALAVHVCAARGETLGQPPPSVSESIAFRLAQTQIAHGRQDWGAVMDFGRGLLSTVERPATAVALLARALFEAAETSPERQERLMEAERLSTELIERIANPDDPDLHCALSVRSNVRHVLGRGAEADEDLKRLRQCVGDSPEVVNNAAVRRFDEGDLEGALAELQRLSVQEHPNLLLLRAQMNLAAGRKDLARRDFDLAMPGVPKDAPPEWRGALADVAFQLGETEVAANLVASIEASSPRLAGVLVTKGRLAFARGAVEEGRRLLREAAELDRSRGRLILLELAAQLRRHKILDEAVSVAVEAGGRDLIGGDLRFFAGTLYEANKLDELKALLEHVASADPAADWVIPILLDLALRAEDPDAAVVQLRALVSRNDARATEARVDVARLLAEADRKVDAYEEVVAALAKESISPAARMNAAQVLAFLGHPDRALAEALLAYRLAPHDSQMHRALVGVGHSTRRAPEEVTEVAAGTHVVLEDGDGKRVAYAIYAERPTDPLRSELLATEASALGLLGKRVGEQVVWNEGRWNEKRMTVVELKSALHHTISDIYEHYEERFPGEPFLHGFRAPDGSVGGWAPLIATVESNKKIEEQVLAGYAAHNLPLGWVARLLRKDIRQLMARLSSNEDQPYLLAEWPPADGLQASLQAADGAPELILTRTALETVERLDILERLRATYSLSAPRTLVYQLQAEAREAERIATDGSMTVGAGPTGLVMQRFEPGDTRTAEAARRASARLEWVRTNAQILSRPLRMLSKPDSAEDDFRDQVGHDSWDAVELAADRGVPLWADDLGLRRVEVGGVRPASVSTISLLLSMAQRQILEEATCYKMLHTLILQRYRFVLPWPNLLEGALSRSQELDRTSVRKVFETLTFVPKIGAAAKLLAKTLKAWSVSAIQSMSLESATIVGLEAMATRWPRPLVSGQLQEAAGREFGLLPNELRVIQKACAAFAKDQEPPSGAS